MMVSVINHNKKFLIHKKGKSEIYAIKWDELFKMFQIRHKYLIEKMEFRHEILEELLTMDIDINREASDA